MTEIFKTISVQEEHIKKYIAQSAGAVEYTDSTSAKG